MGQFKPMVKMFTDEPSVILKLKKGGKVKAAGQDEGFKSMAQTAGANPFDAAESGKAPKKPSMAERQKAMNPNQYKNGGKVAHKQLGGVMPGGAMPTGVSAPTAMGAGALGAAPTAGSAMKPMGRAALAGMTPAKRNARAAMVRKALTGMKKGGSTECCDKLEKELKHHESLSAEKAHKAKGGNVAAFAKTKMHDGDKTDRAHGTGAVKMGKTAGYKTGGTIEGNEKQFENTKMVTAKADKASGTGGVRMSNAGGYKKGGLMCKADGGSIDKKLTRTTVEGGNWENRPANTAKAGVKGTKTGEVKEANAGGYKKGGAAKKAYATGGVVDDGKAVKMPRRSTSRPVANSLQSGTFKKGGKVSKFDDGGSADRGYKNWEEQERKDNEADRRLISELPSKLASVPGRLMKAVKGYFGSDGKPAESVTETQKSVTITPKRKGGKC